MLALHVTDGVLSRIWNVYVSEWQQTNLEMRRPFCIALLQGQLLIYMLFVTDSSDVMKTKCTVLFVFARIFPLSFSKVLFLFV